MKPSLSFGLMGRTIQAADAEAAPAKAAEARAQAVFEADPSPENLTKLIQARDAARAAERKANVKISRWRASACKK